MRSIAGQTVMMPRRTLRFALAAAAVTMLAGCGGLDRNGQFREDPLENFEQKIVGGALASAGVIPPPREKIIYTPRAPLALPPPQAAGRLRQPEDSTQVAAAAPNWPLDPDEARKNRLARQRADTRAEQFRDGQTKRLTIEEIEAGRGTSAGAQGPEPASQRFERGNTVISREELERGWSKPGEGGGWSLFEVDETVDVRDRVKTESTGQAKDYIDKNNGSNNSFEGTLERVDTTRLNNANLPKRNSIVEPPSALRAPAPDPTGGTVPDAQKDERPWWQRLFNS